MKTLAKQAVRGEIVTDPLPTVFPALERLGVRPQRGSVTMIAGPAGAGKTLLGLTMVERMRLRTIYFSADTDEVTMMLRSAALLSGERQDKLGEMLADRELAPAVGKILEGMNHVRWVYNDSPTYYDLEVETAAMAEAYGDYPEVIVIDNMMNLVGDTDNEWQSLRESTKALKHLTRVTGASVLVMHHMNEPNGDQSFPLPRSFVQGRIAQLPEMILSVASDLGRGVVRIGAVKNRWGRQDRTGRTYAEMWLDPDRMMWFEDEYTFRTQTQGVVYQ